MIKTSSAMEERRRAAMVITTGGVMEERRWAECAGSESDHDGLGDGGEKTGRVCGEQE